MLESYVKASVSLKTLNGTLIDNEISYIDKNNLNKRLKVNITINYKYDDYKFHNTVFITLKNKKTSQKAYRRPSAQDAFFCFDVRRLE